MGNHNFSLEFLAKFTPEKSFKILGIQFAPLKIPWHRRFETLAVCYIVGHLFLVAISWWIIFYMLLLTDYYVLALVYIGWLVYDRKTPLQGGRLWVLSRKSVIWKYYTNYFPMKLVKTVDLDPQQNYIFGYHPHGIMSHGAFGNFATDGTGFSRTFPGLTPYLATLGVQFWFPFQRDLALIRGIVDCSKESINWLLQKNGRGNVVVLVVGGAAESLNAVPNTMRLTLKSRKGFVKLAIQNGTSLVPVLSFGENEIFSQSFFPPNSWVRKFQNVSKKLFTFTCPLFHGRGIFQYSFGVLPYRKAIHTIVGAPISVERIENPTQEQIDYVHHEYLQRLSELFHVNKMKYANDPNLKLEFV